MNDEEIVKGKELSLLKTETRESRDLLAGLLADDFLEFGSSGGIYNKKDALEMLPSLDTLYQAEDLETKVLSDDIIQTTFKTIQTKADGTIIKSLRSSIWIKVNNDWQMVFHQGTLIN